MKNSFKDLERLHEAQFESKSNEIKNKIEGENDSIKFVGNVIDLYSSKIVGTLAGMSGIKSKDHSKKD